MRYGYEFTDGTWAAATNLRYAIRSIAHVRGTTGRIGLVDSNGKAWQPIIILGFAPIA